MKQVVTETHFDGNVDISLSYEFCPELIGKKERQEITTNENGVKTVKYWVRVADDRPIIKTEKPIIQENKKYWAKQAKKEKLHKLKDERISRMRKLVEDAGDNEFQFEFTAQDIADGMALQNIIGRKGKSL